MKKSYRRVLCVSESLIINQTNIAKKALSSFIAHIFINEVGLKNDPTAILIGILKKFSEFPLYSKKKVDDLLSPEYSHEGVCSHLSLRSERKGMAIKIFVCDHDIDGIFKKVSIECSPLEKNYIKVRYIIDREEVFSGKFKAMSDRRGF